MLLKGSAECVYLRECVPSCVCFRRVLHGFIEQDGAPPALIPLLFIGLDGPSSNCIKPPPASPEPPRTSLSTVLTTCHSPTRGKHQARRASGESRTGHHLVTDSCALGWTAGGEGVRVGMAVGVGGGGGESQQQKLQGGGI